MGSINNFKKSVLAGICISFSCYAYLYIENKIIASLIFSLALLLICVRKYSLYTGKIAYVQSFGDLIQALAILLGNTAGVFLSFVVMYMADFNVSCRAYKVVQYKLSEELRVIPLAILCNVLIYFAVDTFKRRYPMFVKCLVLVLSIMMFILCGFEHCVANTFYFVAAGQIFTITGLGYLMLNVIGNSIGAIVVHRLNLNK